MFLQANKILSALLLVLSMLLGFSQNIKLDQNEVKTGKSDSEKIHTLLAKVASYRTHYKLDSLIATATEVVKLSKKNKEALFYSYINLGVAYTHKNNIDSSFYYIEKAHELAKQKNDSLLIAKTLIQLNRLHVKINDLEKATEYGLESIRFAENTKNESVLADAYNSLSKVYAFYDDNLQYKKYIDKAYQLVKKESSKVDFRVKSEIYASKMDYFEHLRYNYPKDKKVLDSLQFYLNEGLTYTETIDYPVIKVQLLGLKGKMLYNAGKLSEAEAFYTKALEYKESLPRLSLLNLYHQLAHLYIKKKNIEKGFVYKDIILKDVDKESSLYRKGELYRFAYFICIHAKKVDLAIEYYEKMNQYFNQAKDEKQIAALNELEIKYETQKKDAEIAKQKLENETIKRKAITNYFAFGIIGLLIISTLVFFYLKKKNRVLETELNLANTKAILNRSQLNPHFISNSINAIYPFLYDKSDPNKGAEYLSDLSQMVRSILDSTFDTNWTVNEEIDFIKQYCNIQKLKIDIPLELNIEFDKTLKNTLIPSLVTQTFIENCFIHGFSNKKDLAIINLNISKEAFGIQIQITDNGEVFKHTNTSHTSRSNNIVKQRILNSYSKKDLPKDFLTFGKIETGYQVTIKLPITK